MITEIIVATAAISAGLTYLVVYVARSRQKTKDVAPTEKVPVPLETTTLPPVFGRVVQLSGSRYALEKATATGINNNFAVFHKLDRRPTLTLREVATAEERAQFEVDVFNMLDQPRITLKTLKGTDSYKDLSARFSDAELTAILAGTADLDTIQKLWPTSPHLDSLMDSKSMEEKIKETQEIVRKAMSNFLSNERAIAREARKNKEKK